MMNEIIINNSSTIMTMTSNLSRYFNNTNKSVEDIRQELSDHMAMILLPALLFLGTLMVVGFAGNSLVLYVYLFKVPANSATRPTILALACFDLLTCLVSIPGEILDIRYSYNFMSDPLCKVFRLTTTALLLASGLTLLLVTLDRYRRICHPLRNQITVNATWKRVAGACLTALVLSLLAPLINARTEITTPMTSLEGVTGMECSTDPAYKTVAFVYAIGLGLVFLVTFTTMLVVYTLIARRVLRQSKFRRSSQISQRGGRSGLVSSAASDSHSGQHRPEASTTTNTTNNNDNYANSSRDDDVDKIKTKTSDEAIHECSKESRYSSNTHKDDEHVSSKIRSNEMESTSGDKTVAGEGNGTRSDTLRKPSTQNQSKLQRSHSSASHPRKHSVFTTRQFRSNSLDTTTRRTTLMLFIITLMFVVSFLPHLIIAAVQAATKSLHSYSTSDANNVLYNIFVRSYFLNTAANPFIYGFCSPQFRCECKKLILACLSSFRRAR